MSEQKTPVSIHNSSTHKSARNASRHAVRGHAIALALLVVTTSGCSRPDPVTAFVPLTRIATAGPDGVDYGPWFSVSPTEIGLQFRVAKKRKPPKGEAFTLGRRNVVSLTKGKASIPVASIGKLKAAMRNGKFDVSSRDTIHVVADRTTPVATIRMIHAAAGLVDVTRANIVVADQNQKRTAVNVHPFSRLALSKSGASNPQTVVGLRHDSATNTYVPSIASDGKTFVPTTKVWGAGTCPLKAEGLRAFAATVCKKAPKAEIALALDDNATAENLVAVAKVFREAACALEPTLLSRSGAKALLGTVACESGGANGSPSSPAPTGAAETEVPAQLPGWKAVGKAVVEGLDAAATAKVHATLVAKHADVMKCVPAPKKGQTLVSVQIAPMVGDMKQAARPQVSVASAPGIDDAVQTCIANALGAIAPPGRSYRIARVWLRTQVR